MSENKRLLERLVRFEATRQDLLREIKTLRWDAERELVQLRGDDVATVLRRHLMGELDRQDLEVWADLIEGRDDIGFEPERENQLKQVIYELANPSIMNDLTTRQVEEWIANLIM